MQSHISQNNILEGNTQSSSSQFFLRYILTFLSYAEVVNNKRINKSWKLVVDDAHFWEKRLQNEFAYRYIRPANAEEKSASKEMKTTPGAQMIYRHMYTLKTHALRTYFDVMCYVLNTNIQFANQSTYLPVFGTALAGRVTSPKEYLIYIYDAAMAGNIELLLSLCTIREKSYCPVGKIEQMFELEYKRQHDLFTPNLDHIVMSIADLFRSGNLELLKLLKLPAIFLDYKRILDNAINSGNTELVNALIKITPIKTIVDQRCNSEQKEHKEYIPNFAKYFISFQDAKNSSEVVLNIKPLISDDKPSRPGLCADIIVNLISQGRFPEAVERIAKLSASLTDSEIQRVKYIFSDSVYRHFKEQSALINIMHTLYQSEFRDIFINFFFIKLGFTFNKHIQSTFLGEVVRKKDLDYLEWVLSLKGIVLSEKEQWTDLINQTVCCNFLEGFQFLLINPIVTKYEIVANKQMYFIAHAFESVGIYTWLDDTLDIKNMTQNELYDGIVNHYYTPKRIDAILNHLHSLGSTLQIEPDILDKYTYHQMSPSVYVYYTHILKFIISENMSSRLDGWNLTRHSIFNNPANNVNPDPALLNALFDDTDSPTYRLICKRET